MPETLKINTISDVNHALITFFSTSCSKNVNHIHRLSLLCTHLSMNLLIDSGLNLSTSAYDDILIETSSELNGCFHSWGTCMSFGAAKNIDILTSLRSMNLQPDDRPPTTFPFYYWID